MVGLGSEMTAGAGAFVEPDLNIGVAVADTAGANEEEARGVVLLSRVSGGVHGAKLQKFGFAP
jgi:hypothetical protein